MNGPASLLRARSLRKVYSQGSLSVTALEGLDLDVRPGEFLSIMGPSGSGKSTLMHILGCMDRPTAGSYQLGGQEVSGLDDDSLSRLRNRKIGFVFQDFNLLPRLNALRNVALPLAYAQVGRAEGERAARQALDKVGLSDRVDHLPNQLSGGQQQRVAIARALVLNPQLILADEPTGNLDSHSAAEIMGIFRSLNDEGHTLVLVTHEDDVAACGKRVIVLKDGRLVQDRAVAARAGALP